MYLCALNNFILKMIHRSGMLAPFADIDICESRKTKSFGHRVSDVLCVGWGGGSSISQLLKTNCQTAVVKIQLKETTLAHAPAEPSIHSNQVQALRDWGLTALAQAQERLSMVRLCLSWAIVSMKVWVVLGSA